MILLKDSVSDPWAFGTEMNPESSTFARCVRHPSQFFTGFCSSCLVERLSTVDSAERSPKHSVCPQQKQECSLPVLDFDNSSREVCVRRTLLSLFRLDDGVDAENATKNQGRVEDGCGGTNSISETRGSGIGIVLKSKFSGEHLILETQASSSHSVASDASFTARRKHGSLAAENLKERSVSFWLGSAFVKKVMKWRIRSSSKSHSMQEKSWTGGIGERESEIKFNHRRSCDQKVSYDSNKAVWEDPRHSWDGVMVGKVFTPSFMGIDEIVDLNSVKTPEINWQSSLMTHRRRMSLPEEAMLVDTQASADIEESIESSTTNLADKLLSAECNLREPIGNMHCEETQPEIMDPNIRRRSNGWSKMWNRTLTSPFRDFIQKRENVLKRSLSESWRECHGERKPGTMETDGRLHSRGSSLRSGSKQLNLNRSSNVGSGVLQRYRPDFQKKKDRMLGRSRSVHYASPGNPDNGLLRFYLTPLRSSRRATGKRRMKTSRSFTRGILGF